MVRTQAGFNSEELTPQNWDVREFQGRKATLEIVDAERKRVNLVRFRREEAQERAEDSAE